MGGVEECWVWKMEDGILLPLKIYALELYRLSKKKYYAVLTSGNK